LPAGCCCPERDFDHLDAAGQQGFGNRDSFLFIVDDDDWDNAALANG